MKDVKAKAGEKKAADDKASKAPVATPETPKAAPKKAKGNRMGEEEILALYPHAKPGTLRFLGTENKQVVTIGCIEDGCDATREVRTSDLFQVKRCRACTLKARRANTKAKRVAKRLAEKAD